MDEKHAGAGTATGASLVMLKEHISRKWQSQPYIHKINYNKIILKQPFHMRPLAWFAASGRHLLQVEEENLLMTAKHFDQEPVEEEVLTLYSYLQTFSVHEAKQRGSSSLSEVS